MDDAQLFQHYQELQRYIGWTADDARRVRDLQPLVEPDFPAIVADFYEEIARHPSARRVIQGGSDQIERLRRTLLQWLAQLFGGVYDAEYVARRWRVGLRHVEIGLEQKYANVALGRIRSGLMRGVCGKWTGTHAELLAVVEALNRLLDLDLAIIEDAYQYEFLQRQKRAERLIAIGQMSGGIAHELRNPLNVVRTSVFYLRNARHITPEKQNEHLLRIERQVTVADGVITALSDFAKLPLPQFQPVAVRTLIDGTLHNLTIPPGTEVLVQCGGDVPPIQGDVRQLMIVLSNLVRNAVDAMPHGGRLTIRAVEGAAEVALSVTDSGAGIAIEDQRRIFEPFFSTKTRGIGLGLAISRAIVENHRGKLHVTSRPGEGSCFTISLPVASVP